MKVKFLIYLRGEVVLFFLVLKVLFCAVTDMIGRSPAMVSPFVHCQQFVILGYASLFLPIKPVCKLISPKIDIRIEAVRRQCYFGVVSIKDSSHWLH